MTAAVAIEYGTTYTACGKAYEYVMPGEALSDSGDVRADYESAPLRGHYFDANTTRFFGARNFCTVTPGASVELHTNAPGDKYRVQIWKAGTDTQGPQPWFGCRHATRADAVRCAKATAELLRSKA